MKKSIILIVVIMFTAIGLAQNSLAKIEYNYAEEAFAQQDYKKTLEHLEEVKSILGSTNALVMYLEINALPNTFSYSRNSIEDYQIYRKLDDLTTSFISNFENDVPIEKLKAVYEIQKEYKNYALEFDNLIKGKNFLENKNYDAALLHFSIACEAENPEACKNMASVYGQKNDFENTKKFNDKAIALGSINAKFNEGLFLYYGIYGYNVDEIKGVQLMEETYSSGFLYASYTLGVYYSQVSPSLSKFYFSAAYNEGKDKRASVYLALWPDVIDENIISDALEEINDRLIKEPTNGNFNYYKASLLLKRNQHSEAIKYYQLACDNGNAISCKFLAEQYIKGNETYKISKDIKKSIELMSIACTLDPQYCN